MHRHDCCVNRHTPPLRPVSRGAEEAATAVEYGVLVALVGVVLVAAGPQLAAAALSLLDTITGSMLG